MKTLTTHITPNTLYGREDSDETYYVDVRGRAWCVQSPDLNAREGRPCRAELPSGFDALDWALDEGDLQDVCADLDHEAES